jgi:pimeloyl-ACP methyl ester carboxylesterase
MPALKLSLGEYDFHVRDEGTGEPVLLLHGFPDSSALWRHLVPELNAAGYRAIAPDLRGFGESARPQEASAYAMQTLLGDVTGLLDALDIPRAHLVTHDWGAALGWAFAAYFPDRVQRHVALSVGHLTSYFNAGLAQREKSWYMLFFQFQGVAESHLTANDWALFRDFVRHHPECEKWIGELGRPGALTAGLNWYRANVVPEAMTEERWILPAVSAPTLGLWSSNDAYLTETQMLGSREFVTGPWAYRRIEGASHWMQLDRPAVVNAAIIEFLNRRET